MMMVYGVGHWNRNHISYAVLCWEMSEYFSNKGFPNFFKNIYSNYKALIYYYGCRLQVCPSAHGPYTKHYALGNRFM